ncbi:pantetheine-phosphate adenylyltransferase [candidate division TA06 bacterium]|uniref:Phosphopantetheine adenylyltransferase n=1 Tax=candidate division TA06 bacterium TaxID=2250710 RepID=A0A523UW04_UNCT6|nr:MAG: pantetheine-phosphate adenylyltransferase [candidate division TA06 bacterium]
MSKVIYPGTFDPITNGHIDVVDRCLKLFEKVIVAVGSQAQKIPLFTVDERLEMMHEVLKDKKNVEVDTFEGLLVNYADSKGAVAVVRGLRAVSDFEYEFQMALMSRKLLPSVERIFLVPAEEHVYLSSSVVKEIAGLGGDVSQFVPEVVAERLKAKQGKK